MRLEHAMSIIEKSRTNGYRVRFEYPSPRTATGVIMLTDYFPNADERSIASKIEAAHLAKQFAEATSGKYANVHVVDAQTLTVVDVEGE